jgi:hypothetical protein
LAKHREVERWIAEHAREYVRRKPEAKTNI